MFSPTRKLIAMAVLCVVLFIAGMIQLFLLRFEAGDVYPPYSSLRTDPLGTLALFESLNLMAPGSAVRNYRPLNQVALNSNTTLMIIGLGADGFFWQRENLDKLLENLAREGGRLVLTFTPAFESLSKGSANKEETDEGKGSGRQKEEEPVEEFVEEEPSKEDEDGGCEDRRTWYGMNALGFRVNPAPEEPEEEVAVRFVGREDILPPTITWRAPLSFELRENSWETLYTWQGAPAVVRRPWGNGTVVMAADSYLLSNEALRNHRFAGLLVWLVGPGQDIVFDEYNKGLVLQPGVAGLARQYRLHGVVAAILIVALLFVWRHSTVFVPLVRTEPALSHIQPAAGPDTSQGLVHLVRQHIAIGELLPLCYRTWKNQATRRVSAARMAEVEAMVQQAAKDSKKETQVSTYREICELLKQGKRS